MIQIADNIKFSYNKDISLGGEDCKNILIKGDNKYILPELASIYSGRIKCIYIDPPYNNGDTYHYYNDNISTATWLSYMRTVLIWLKQLLSKDGSLWISIDDREMAYLKVEADKIFGRENFATTIVWQQRKTRENRAVFSCNHEYILVYAKDIGSFKKSRNLLPVGADFVDSRYRNPDNDPRGPWQSVTASVQAGHAVPSQFYTITAPSGAKFYPPKGRCWVYNHERMEREIADNNIWFGADGTNTPRIKKFLANARIGLTPETLWAGDIYGTTDSAKKHLLALFPDVEQVFDTPKPEELIKQILDIASNKGDYVLDCFLGSGTTLSVAHKLERNYIGIEIGDQMIDLVVRRMNRVVEGEQGGISREVNWKGGGQFSYFDFDKNCKEDTIVPVKEIKSKQPAHYRQLDFMDLFDRFGNSFIVENSFEDDNKTCISKSSHLYSDKSVLVSLVKNDNKNSFLRKTAGIYYTGKKFPSSIDLSHLLFFMPYIKGKGIRDLYLIRSARVGTRKEGQPDNDPNDLRLLFEIEFLGELFLNYKSVDLKIWHTFTETTMEEILLLE